MVVLDLFSKRKNRAAKTAPDVYTYDDLPLKMRNQIALIWSAAIGDERRYRDYDGPPYANQVWTDIHEKIIREHGKQHLANRSANPQEACVDFLRTSENFDEVMDLVELVFLYIDMKVRKDLESRLADREGATISQLPDDAIEELNIRFQENGVGYQYVNQQLIRVDSQLAHKSIVLPAIQLLSEKGFDGPNEEFMNAHTHYRQGKYKEAIVNAENAFESTMKTICKARGWKFDPKKATARDLIDVIMTNHLIPDYMTNHMAGLRSALEGGLPTVRNKTSGHGQGPEPKVVDEYVAAYALHLAAANILMLVRAHKAMK